jgi:hypothetical protein
MANRGLLLTLTEPPPGMEEEFNAWYDTEHLAERLAIPGFRSARRWVLGKSYLATYELDSPGVLTSKPYLEKFNNQSPWSKRCLGKCVVFKRWACEQMGSADPHPETTALLFNGEASSVLQSRKFVSTTGETLRLDELRTWQPGAYRAYAA